MGSRLGRESRGGDTSDDDADSYSSEFGEDNVVKEGEYVIMQGNDGRHNFALAEMGHRAKIVKGGMEMGHIVGQPYGSVFEVHRNEAILLDENDDLIPEGIEERPLETDELGGVAEDNSTLHDLTNNQTMTHEEIEAMKRSGISGEDVISRLVDGSETFLHKTEFSRRKWLQKACIRYRPRFRVLRVNAQLLCDTLSRKHPQKTGNLRSDRLSIILSKANLCAGKQVLLFDSLMGIVQAAVLERIGCHGRIISIETKQNMNTAALRYVNTPKEVLMRVIISINTKEVGRSYMIEPPVPIKEGDDRGEEEEDEEKVTRFQKELNKIQENSTDEQIHCYRARLAHRGFPPDMIEKKSKKLRKRIDLAPLRSLKPSTSQIKSFLRNGSDSLIIATRFRPLDILRHLLPLLALSCPFVLYCEYIEPLVECFVWAQETRQAIQLELYDCWQREYQVTHFKYVLASLLPWVIGLLHLNFAFVLQILPHRTHPFMKMDGKGAYILSGIKVFPKGEDDLHAERNQHRKSSKSRVRPLSSHGNGERDTGSYNKRQRRRI